MEYSTYSFFSVSPDPIGVGQKVDVNFWVDQPPPTASGQYGDRWTNMTVKVTHPDGTTETLGPFTSDDTGGAQPPIHQRIGNYTFQILFGGQTLAGNNLAPGTPHLDLALTYISATISSPAQATYLHLQFNRNQ